MAPRKTPGGGPKPDKLMRDALALELHQEVKLTIRREDQEAASGSAHAGG